MSIFEDLIDALKEDNLIEQTVIETSQIEEENRIAENQAVNVENKFTEEDFNLPVSQELISQTNSTVENVSQAVTMSNAADTLDSDAAQNIAAPIVDETEFYRQKAMNEVAFLQIVEAAFAGVEREQLKTVPRQFDDLKVKKVLHAFLQVCSDANSPEYSKAEFQLLKETESWYSSLSLRDMRFMTANLRRYCETTRPQLSSPALVALARFYRNSPYSEQIRSKFDLIVTRLFSKDIGANKREVVFERDELVGHLQELYADWSSVPLYSTDENDAAILQIARKFEDFISEAASAQSFDELIAANFFNRLRLFKEHSSENFYAPVVAATAIECNIRVGNLYVELLEKEKNSGNISGLEDKYGLSHDQAISEATGKTLSLVELLRQKNEPPKLAKEKNTIALEPIVAAQPTRKPEKAEKKQSEGAAKSKKWMVSVALLAVIIITGIYFATSSNSVKVEDVQSVPKMNLDNSMLKEYLLEARIEDSTLKGIVSPTWNHLTGEKKKDALKQMVSFGADKGYKKIQLVNQDKKPVATAEDGFITILD